MVLAPISEREEADASHQRPFEGGEVAVQAGAASAGASAPSVAVGGDGALKRKAGGELGIIFHVVLSSD